MPKMIYEHSSQIEKELAVIKKQGFINDVDVSNKSKTIDFAIRTLAELIKKNPNLIINKQR